MPPAVPPATGTRQDKAQSDRYSIQLSWTATVTAATTLDDGSMDDDNDETTTEKRE